MTKFDPAKMELPEEINEAAWIEWCADRKERRKPMTERAAIIAINKLKPFSKHDQAMAIMQAIEHGWTSVYPKSNEDRQKGFIERHTDKTWRKGITH